MSIPETMSVNEVIRLHPASVAVFNRYGVDACCGGARSVAEAAADAGVRPDELRDALLRAAGDRR